MAKDVPATDPTPDDKIRDFSAPLLLTGSAVACLRCGALVPIQVNPITGFDALKAHREFHGSFRVARVLREQEQERKARTT